MSKKLSWVLLIAALVLLGCEPQRQPSSIPTVLPRADTVPPTMLVVRGASPSPSTTLAPGVWPTFTPLPIVPHTPIPDCPVLGNPSPPSQTSRVSDFAGLLENYLNTGASIESLDQLLREWAWLRRDTDVGERSFGGHMAWNADLTGDATPETIAMADYCSSTCPCLGDLLIWQCRDGQMELLFSAFQSLPPTEDGGLPYYQVLRIGDANENHVPDIMFKSSRVGIHANMVRLHVIEWDGTAFVERAPGFPEMPDPFFGFDYGGRGQLVVVPGWFSSRGAGIPRPYYQRWMWETWEGPYLTLLEDAYGLPTARIQYLYDGDDELVQRNMVAALANYQQAIIRTDLPTGLLYMKDAEETLLALAQLKLMVAYAVAEDNANMEATYQRLQADIPTSADSYIYVQMARVFWESYHSGQSPAEACTAATAIADPSMMYHLDAGYAKFANYANTRYENPADLCRGP